MSDPYHLQRFVDAQAGVYETALREIQSGAKQGHWMWFIFPQLAGLGLSPTAQYYAIGSLDEACAYLQHPLLGPRLRECLEAILPWMGRHSAADIFGPVDTQKLKSSLTLFDRAEPGGIFADGLAAFFDRQRDERTLALLEAAR